MARSKAGGGGTFIAVQSGVAEIDGEGYVFVKGATLVQAGHPLLDSVPDYFEPVDEHRHYTLEQATATPGETRE